MNIINFLIFIKYFFNNLFNNIFRNNYYDIEPPELTYCINYHYWLLGYDEKTFGWVMVQRRANWDFWMLRLGCFGALCCKYHNMRLRDITRFNHI